MAAVASLATVETHDGQTVAVAVGDDRLLAVDAPDGGPPFADVGALLADHDWRRHVAAASRALNEPVRRWRTPILDPGAIVCVGHNFAEHIRELGHELPAAPTLFSKLSRALVDPADPVVLPRSSTSVDYEGEVVLVVGRPGRAITPADAWEHVAGVTLMNDVSVRDVQRRSTQWFAGKTWERSTPVGPSVALVGPDEFARLRLETYVNGELRQAGRLSDLVFGVPELIADLSQIVMLRPGDLIATGTPGGVGVASTPPRFLCSGDVTEVRVTGVGSLTTRFADMT